MKLKREFYTRDVLEVAPDLIGKILVRKWPSGEIGRYVISETEAYRGKDDKACHASKGKTRRTEPMFENGGILYMYLIYGMYWMLNVVTSVKNEPQAVLIRSIEDVNGPGRLTRMLQLDRTFNSEELNSSERIWIEDSEKIHSYVCKPRIGIDYAGEYWKNMPWRYILT